MKLKFVGTPATAAAAAAEFTTTAAAARRTFFARTRDVDGEGAAIEFLAVHRGNRLLCFLGRSHRDEREPARTAAYAVHHQVGFHDCAVRREGVLQIVFGCFEGKISNKQFCAHVMFCSTRLT
jgi:hypothetical protein